MKRLSQQQIDSIIHKLELEKITFDPLRNELLDHVISDIEHQLSEGKPFEMALTEVEQNLPNNHFQDLQYETMKLLHQKFHLTRIFAILSLILLAGATLFKILRFPGTGVLLMSFMIVATITLIAGSWRSMSVYQDLRGRSIVWAITLTIIAFVSALLLRIVNHPATDLLNYVSVGLAATIFPGLSMYFYRSRKRVQNHLIITLIKEHQQIIEKTALVLIGFGILFNYVSLLSGNANLFAGIIFFIFSIVLIGMYIYSLTWKYYVELTHQKSALPLLIVSTIAFILFLLPLLGSIIPRDLRQFSAYLPSVIFSVIVFSYYLRYSDAKNRSILAILSSFLVFYPLLKLGIKLQWFEGWLGALTSNPTFILGFLIFLVGLLILFRKERMFRVFIILTIASHMLPTL